MEKKDPSDLIIMIVMFVAGLLAVVSAAKPNLNGLFTGASIMFSASLICRSIQWGGKE
jgi:hypothetical protein